MNDAMAARLASIIECSDDAIVSKNLDGIITSWNPGAERLFGYSAAEMLGKPMLTVIPPERADEEPMILARIARGEVTDHFETVRLRKDGRRVHVSVTISPIKDEQGRVIGASKIARDITDRKQAADRVQAQLKRLNLLQQVTRAIGEHQDIRSIYQVVIRTLEEQLPLDLCCIGLHDSIEHELLISCVSASSEALIKDLVMAEQTRLDIAGNGLAPCVAGKLVYEPNTPLVSLPFAQRLASAGLSSMVVTPLSVESKMFGVLIAARREANSFSSGDCEFLKQASEHVALAAHQSQLYSALQQAYDDLRLTQNAVMQHERLLALGQMSSGIAHDINNALSPMALYTEMLLEKEPGLSPRARSSLGLIQRAIEDIAQTIARMREFYRQREQEATLVPVNLNSLANDVVELTRARWSDMAQQRGIAIEVRMELEPHLPPILGAANELREALVNLIFNAVDAMPVGGPLTVRTCLAGNDTPRSETFEDTFVQIEVIDSGIGMDEATRRRCLDPFFTTKGERGTGLGLAMVYGTVQRHSGDIEIDSACGNGTTVRLKFPIPKVIADSAPALPAIERVPTQRILLIDDDPIVLKSLRDALEADGHDITAVDGGQAGIDAFLASLNAGASFPVVITDLGMPYVDGRQVAHAVKSAAPSTIVLLVTGWGQRLAADGDIPLHVDRVLGKPPKLRELRAALAECASSPSQAPR